VHGAKCKVQGPPEQNGSPRTLNQEPGTKNPEPYFEPWTLH